MTEFLASRTNPTTGIASERNWQNDIYSAQRVSPAATASPVAMPPAVASVLSSVSAPTATGATEAEINLREALEWLLGSDKQDTHLSEDEKEARKARRTELLMWLLNLELRLSPYGDPV